MSKTNHNLKGYNPNHRGAFNSDYGRKVLMENQRPIDDDCSNDAIAELIRITKQNLEKEN